jgi:hypothetical protein
MPYRHLVLLTVILLATVCGCRGARPLGQPPGTIQQQRLNGTVHDPYADPDAGPYTEGTRPRDYQNPWSEAQRSQSLWGGWWGGNGS